MDDLEWKLRILARMLVRAELNRLKVCLEEPEKIYQGKWSVAAITKFEELKAENDPAKFNPIWERIVYEYKGFERS